MNSIIETFELSKEKYKKGIIKDNKRITIIPESLIGLFTLSGLNLDLKGVVSENADLNKPELLIATNNISNIQDNIDYYHIGEPYWGEFDYDVQGYICHLPLFINKEKYRLDFYSKNNDKFPDKLIIIQYTKPKMHLFFCENLMSPFEYINNVFINSQNVKEEKKGLFSYAVLEYFKKINVDFMTAILIDLKITHFILNKNVLTKNQINSLNEDFKSFGILKIKTLLSK